MALGKFKLALKDFEAVKRVRPRDKDALAKYTECNKVVRQMAFEKAIAVESSRKKPSQTIDLETMGENLVQGTYIAMMSTCDPLNSDIPF